LLQFSACLAIITLVPDKISFSKVVFLMTTESLSTKVKLAYGVGDLGPALVSAVSGFFLNVFLLEVAGLAPATAALIFVIVKIWDSMNDPLVGSLTDKTNTRWGRRRPWLLFGAIPFALAYYLQWQVPELSDGGKFWYYLLVALLLDTGFTAVNVPYAALTPELAKTYDERTSLNAYRFGFSILGGMFGAFFQAVILDSYRQQGNVEAGYALSAGIIAAIIIISNVITFAFTSEGEFSQDDQEEIGFFEGVRIAFNNRPFLYVTVIYLLAWLAIQFVQNNLLLYVKYWVGAEDQFQWLILILQGGAFIFLMVWTQISKRIGKQNVYYAGMIFWIIASLALWFVPRNNITPIYFIALIASVGVSVAYLIPWSLLPDVVDLDELNTGQRREGIYYGFFVFLQKLGISVGLAISNLILGATGYIAPETAAAALNPTQPAPVLTALRAFVSLAPILIILASIVVVYLYPITKERHQEILAQLEKRRNKSM
jgi:GPH family glycoside/pentoside/hexuronide:cation symporter